MFPISFLEGVQIDFQRISGWMTFETISDYENLIQRYKQFPVLADEICDTLELALEKEMVHHAVSMVSRARFR